MVRLTDRPDMTLDVYRGRKTTIQQQLFCDKKQAGHTSVSYKYGAVSLAFVYQCVFKVNGYAFRGSKLSLPFSLLPPFQ